MLSRAAIVPGERSVGTRLIISMMGSIRWFGTKRRWARRQLAQACAQAREASTPSEACEADVVILDSAKGFLVVAPPVRPLLQSTRRTLLGESVPRVCSRVLGEFPCLFAG